MKYDFENTKFISIGILYPENEQFPVHPRGKISVLLRETV